MEHNEQHLMTDGDPFVEQLPGLEGVHALASLVPSVLSRLRAVNASIHLGSQGDQVDQLMAALEDSDWHVRATAVRLLGELAEQTPIEPLLVALNDEDGSVRAAAVWALGKLGERVPVDRLVTALHDSEWAVREIAALTLGEMGERAPAGPLIDILHAEDEDTYVRDAARMALQQTHPAVLSPLTSGAVMTSQAQKRDSGETGGHMFEGAKLYSKFKGLAQRLSRRNTTDKDWQEEGDILGIPPALDDVSSSGSVPQQPVLARPKRHLALRIAEGILAVLLIASIAVSWLALAQKLRPSFFSSSSHTRQTPTAGFTISPSWLGHNVGLTIVDGVAYLGTLDKAVYALRVSDATLLWRYNTDRSVDGPPLVVNGVVYVSVAPGSSYLPGYVYALRASDGTLLWRYTSDSYVYTPTLVNGVVYVGSGDGTVFALRASDGTVLWHYTTKGSVDDSPLVVNGMVYVSTYVDNGPAYLYALRVSDGSLLWRYTTKGFVYTSTVIDGVAYISENDLLGGGIVALRASDGSLLWRYAPVSTGFSSPTVVNGIVYTIGTKFSPDTAPTRGGGYLLQTTIKTLPSKEKTPFKELGAASVYALRASDGALLWHYKANKGENILGTLLSVADGVIYIDANVDMSKSYIYALRGSDGSVLWRYMTEDDSTSALVANGIIYIGLNDGTIYALRTSNGSLLWRSSIYGTVLNTPILVGESVYVGTTSGFVYALQASNGSLLWHYLIDVG